MNKSKKMLLVSYLFPPIGGGGVPRPLKMAKYLARLGWEVHVLTVDTTYHATKDETLLKELPSGVTIHRAKEWNPLNGIRRSKGSASGNQEKTVPRLSQGSQGRLKKMKSFVVSSLKQVKNTLFIPDEQIGWLPDASRLGARIVREHNIPVMFSTSGPHTSHLVARTIKRKTGIHWVADFRDPWTQNMHRSQIPWREALEEKMERGVMTEADVITTVTHGFAENFLRKYEGEIKQLEVIHNGFDPEDYENIQTDEEDGKFTLIYTGIFYQQRNPRLLLQGVKELLDEGKIDTSQITLQFAGVFDYPGYTDNWDCVHHLQLEDMVEVMGNLPHKQALKAMKNADVLLLIGDTAPGSGVYIPGKLYEYMAIGHPILALSLEGESTNIIKQFQLGEVVDPLNKDEIKNAFLNLYNQWKKDKTISAPSNLLNRANEGDLSIYNRQIQAQMLSAVMDKLVAKD